VLRGRLDVIGRHFEVQKDSQVRFGGPVDQPYLNVTAVHTNEREAVTVFVSVVGHGKDFALKTSSQPPLPDSEIFTLLTTGRRNLKLGGGSSISAGDAASVLGSLAASQLKTLVAKKLPLDVLSVESGKDGIQTAKVEAGTYLSDQVYLGYQLQLGADRSKAENVNALRIEYQISKSWSLEATAGDAPAGGAELVWGREY
jgi:translocation and assembly module TamB